MAIDGLDEFQRAMRRLQDNVQKLSGTRTVPVTDLLTDEFMTKHTSYSSAQQLFDDSGFQIASPEEFLQIPDHEWNAFISRATPFASWDEMLGRAGEEYVVKQLEL